MLPEWLKSTKPSYLSLLYAIQTILGLLQLLDFLSIEYVLMTHRVTKHVSFSLPVSLIIPLLLTFCIWTFYSALKSNFQIFILPALSFLLYPILGFEITISTASILSVVSSLSFDGGKKEYLTWFFWILTGFEVLSLSHWLIFLPFGLKTPIESIAHFEMELSYLANNISEYLVLAIIFISLFNMINIFTNLKKDINENVEQKEYNNTSLFSVILLIVIVFSVFAAIYPYLHNINTLESVVGVDVINYLNDVEIIENDTSKLFNVWYGSRPTIYIHIYTFQKIFNLNALSAITFFPIILNPVFALSIFFIGMEVFNDIWTSCLASFFSILGYYATVGMYAYLLTNMLGLCFVYFTIGFILRAIRNGNKKDLTIASMFGALLLFTHPWTFIQYMLPLIITFVVAIIRNNNNPSNNKGINNKVFRHTFYLIIILLVLLEIYKISYYSDYFRIAYRNIILRYLTSFSSFWIHLKFSMKYMFSGFLSNTIILVLVLFGILACKTYTIPRLYLLFFMGISSTAFLLGNATFKSRILFNIPVGLFEALGFFFIIKNIDSISLRRSFSSFIITFLTTALFRGLANLV